MNTETSKFIAARTPFTEGMAPVHVAKVERRGGGAANACYHNAQLAKENGLRRGKRIALVSGWIVNRATAPNGQFSIIAHWWNRDADNKHFDTTPMIGVDDCEYVQDLAVFMFCYKHDARLETHQHRSLLWTGEHFEVMLGEEKMTFRKIDDLRTENFYLIG